MGLKHGVRMRNHILHRAISHRNLFKFPHHCSWVRKKRPQVSVVFLRVSVYWWDFLGGERTLLHFQYANTHLFTSSSLNVHIYSLAIFSQHKSTWRRWNSLWRISYSLISPRPPVFFFSSAFTPVENISCFFFFRLELFEIHIKIFLSVESSIPGEQKVFFSLLALCKSFIPKTTAEENLWIRCNF